MTYEIHVFVSHYSHWLVAPQTCSALLWHHACTAPHQNQYWQIILHLHYSCIFKRTNSQCFTQCHYCLLHTYWVIHDKIVPVSLINWTGSSLLPPPFPQRTLTSQVLLSCNKNILLKSSCLLQNS